VHAGENLPPESFEQLAIPHFERLYNFACWLTHDRQEAEDLVQETYVKALKGFPSFQPGTNFRAWIYKILRNTFLTSRTGLKATATVPLDLEGEEEALPTDKETPESILLQRSDEQLCSGPWRNCQSPIARSCCYVMSKRCLTRKSLSLSPSRWAR
jgi:RNA polymerase sigma-70 factor (ECF subfamily)